MVYIVFVQSCGIYCPYKINVYPFDIDMYVFYIHVYVTKT